MSAPVFVYTSHAADNLVDRGIERSWVERTILTPEATETDPQHRERIRAYRTVPERDGRVLRVVYVRQAALTYRVITLFLDRGWRRRREGPIRSGS